MAKFCPIRQEYVVYLDCLECEEKICRQTDTQKNSSHSLNSTNPVNHTYMGEKINERKNKTDRRTNGSGKA